MSKFNLSYIVNQLNLIKGNSLFANSLSVTPGQNYLEGVIAATNDAVTLVTQIHVAQSILFYFGGTHDGTINFEASLSDGVWVPINVTPAGGGAEITSTTATDGIFIAPVEAWGQFRIRGSNWVSGSVSAGVSDLALPYKNTVKIFGAVTVTNDNSFAKETGGNLDEIEANLDSLLEGHNNTRDTNNEQSSPLTGGSTFTGTYTKIDTYQSVQILYAATSVFTASIVWSNDGVNPLGGSFGTTPLTIRQQSGYYFFYQVYSGDIIAPYYKLVVVNGASNQTAYPGFISIAWLNNSPYNGSYGLLTDSLTTASKALLARSVIAGTKPDGTFSNVGVSADNSLFVEQLFPAPNITADASTNSHFGTLKGNTVPTLVGSPWGLAGSATQFNGIDNGSNAANQRVDFGSRWGLSGAFSVELKAQVTGTSTQLIASKWNAAVTNGANWRLYANGTAITNVLIVDVTDGTGTNKQIIGGTDMGTTIHDICLDYDGTTLRLFLDGVLDGSIAVASLKAYSNSVPTLIGLQDDSGGNGFPLTGIIDEFRISSISRHTSGYTPPTTAFVTDTDTTLLAHLDTASGPHHIVDANAKNEDSPHASGDVGTFILGVRNDANSTLTSTDSDYSAINVDKAGRAQVRDEFDSFETQKITLVASTDTTVTFAQEVGLVKVLNTNVTNVAYIKDGSISSDTPTDAQQIGIAPTTNVPNVDWFPFKTTTLHLRSAGTNVLYVTGFYRNNS